MAMPIHPKRLVRPGQLAGNSEKARGIFFLFSLFIFLSMKPSSVEMACLLGIQNEIQAVCNQMMIKHIFFSLHNGVITDLQNRA